ncbi:STAS domain-containing protein [Streptomyces sp. NPDC006314]|uniref:STAS domain-containing protein n=1 Tax=Streptomyces sp. NPDC006314 TaxID=3154475 RepID=UPI0033A02081
MSKNHTRSGAAEQAGPAAVTAHRAPGGTTLLPLHREIDLLAAPALSEQLDALTGHPHPDLVLDLRPVDFIDCAGLGVLCRARNRVLARRGRLRLITESAGLLRTLRVTGLRDVFEVHPRLPGHLLGTSGPP